MTRAGWAFLDRDRRLYVALSRDGSYYHVVHPLAADVLDADGNVVRAAGELTCVCKGATFHGRCYRIDEAARLEREPTWLQPTVAPETELEKMAARG